MRQTWQSSDAYNSWYNDGDTNFVGILFDADNDYGNWQPDSLSKIDAPEFVNDIYQWGIDEDDGSIFISVAGEIDPNKTNSKIGLIYPWALRPKLKERTDDFDVYEYGEDKEEWTADDQYYYYGANVAESWFTRYNPTWNTDWHASTKSRIATHNTEVVSGEIFGDTPFTDPADTLSLIHI